MRKQRLEEREACALFHQLVDGVEYLHSLEVRVSFLLLDLPTTFFTHPPTHTPNKR